MIDKPKNNPDRVKTGDHDSMAQDEEMIKIDGESEGEDVPDDRVEDESDIEDNGNEIDSDGESDLEEVSEEQKGKILEEAVTNHAEHLYSKLVINKGRKYADKFKVHLKDIAREQLLEVLGKKKARASK